MLEKETIKKFAQQAGFAACGIAQAESLPQDAAFLHQWLMQGKHASMLYMEQNFEKRTDPRALVDGAQTVIVGLHDYYTPYEQAAGEKRIARFKQAAVNYHKTVRKQLRTLEELLIAHYGTDIVHPELQHSFCDTAPILERRWAERAGLGWIGKNKLFIHPELGSYTNIGILILNTPADSYDTPTSNKCGSCTQCLDKCPTGAISASQMFDSHKCISYLTTATKNPIPEEFIQITKNIAFGCDVCADNCPWNKKRKIKKTP